MEQAPEEIPVSEARSNFTDVIAQTRLLRQCIFLTRRGKPQVAVVPVELGEAARNVGGVEAAIKILSEHQRRVS
ncbi:type II toxin-antitoxin system prevent-host-death family antitoxin [Nocardiopsis tropica]|uniref:type II toxin-antitoxin system prevent-host-death family antitoxin n=1 Tax=Nocardiopsis tropica TaxID=109330 RepID=UPI002E8CAE7E|nr:type II toxin-antitoxin system prevent-host-death family antitoxin [Nocardiopsis tropica]